MEPPHEHRPRVQRGGEPLHRPAGVDGLEVHDRQPRPPIGDRAGELPGRAPGGRPQEGPPPHQPRRPRSTVARRGPPEHGRLGAPAPFRPQADGGQPGGHRAVAQGRRRRRPARLGWRPSSHGAVLRLGPPGEQHLPRHQPVQGRGARWAGPQAHHPGPRAVRERHPPRGGRGQEPLCRRSDGGGHRQLQRYSNQRHWVDGNEGNERLFFTNQFLVATCFDRARVGTIGASAHHYMEWKDTAPSR
jgi:hypothetical protein